MEPFRIVAVLDRSELSEIVLEHALDHARRYPAPELHFLTIVEDPHASLDDVKERMTALVLDNVELFQRLHPEWSGHLHVRFGWRDREIPAFSKDVRANLVVLRVDEDLPVIAKATPCPLLVISLDEPELETGECPDCARARIDTHGQQFFCKAHASDHVSMRIPELPVVGGSTDFW